MKTKIAIGVAAALLLGVYLFRLRRRRPDPSGDIGIEVCSPSQSYDCAEDYSETGGRPSWLDLIDPYPGW